MSQINDTVLNVFSSTAWEAYKFYRYFLYNYYKINTTALIKKLVKKDNKYNLAWDLIVCNYLELNRYNI